MTAPPAQGTVLQCELSFSGSPSPSPRFHVKDCACVIWHRVLWVCHHHEKSTPWNPLVSRWDACGADLNPTPGDVKSQEKSFRGYKPLGSCKDGCREPLIHIPKADSGWLFFPKDIFSCLLQLADIYSPQLQVSVLQNLLKLSNDLKVLVNYTISSQTWNVIQPTDWGVDTDESKVDSKYCVKRLL